MREPQGSYDLCFLDQPQLGFWNYPDAALHSSPLENHIALGSPMAKLVEHRDYYLTQDRKINSIIEKQAFGVERPSHSLPRTLDHNLGVRSIFGPDLASYSAEGDRISIMGSQCENGLFSSSLSELFSRKLRLPTNNFPHGHSVGAADSHYEEEEPFESLKELEAHTIGNLLPDDDDLLAGVTDGLDYVGQPNAGDDIEDLDFFSSVGGMDLGEDGSSPRQQNSEFAGNHTLQLCSSNALNGGEHPIGGNPSRTLFVRNINSSVEDSELQTLFEQFGDIHTLYTACKHRGFVMISYYDIRASQHAMQTLQNKPLRRRKLDIHFSIPKEDQSEKDVSQGTLVVFNLDSSVSNDELRQIFGVYGEIKEIRETPHRSHHKCIEFYDIRAAETALRALNKSDIAGKRIKVEASHPGGIRRLSQQFLSELEQAESVLYLQQNSPSSLATGFSGALPHGRDAPSMENGYIMGRQSASGSAVNSYLDNAFDCGISFSVPNSLLRSESKGNQANVGETGHLHSQTNFEFRGTSALHPHSLPEYHDGLSNGASSISPGGISATMNIRPLEAIENRKFSRVSSNGHSVELNEVFTPNGSGNGNCPSPGHQYMWSNSHQPQPQGMMRPNSPTFVGGVCATHPQQLHAVPRAPSNNMLSALVPINNHHVGSAPSVNPSLSLWDRRHAYAGDSPDASGFHPGSLGSMRISGNSPHSLEFIHHNVFPRTGGSCIDLPMSSSNVGLHCHHQRSLMFPGRGQIFPLINSFDSPNERMRSRRTEGNSSQTDNKKQFELDIDRIVRGDDKRTTLMIKNIPNKYTSKMLLAAIDERHRGTYDFLYLPIDFKNKCNVGYAFINMTDPSLIVPFYQAFNGKKWEKFNSEKVASLAYARIQGKAALIAHFQNSSLMNEDKRCRPILFHTDGPNAGDQGKLEGARGLTFPVLQVPFPMGVNIRPRTSKNRAGTSEESYQESQTSLPTGKDFVNEESSSGPVKESN